jgi:hypothetical protein
MAGMRRLIPTGEAARPVASAEAVLLTGGTR